MHAVVTRPAAAPRCRLPSQAAAAEPWVPQLPPRILAQLLWALAALRMDPPGQLLHGLLRRSAAAMRCCFGGGSNVVRCHVAITAQLSVEGAAEGSTRPRRTSAASLHALPTAEHGTDVCSSPGEFTPPSHFPGLATLVSGHLRAGSRARSVEVRSLTCAPAAGAAMLVCITLVCDLTFAAGSPRADEWRVALRNAPAVLNTETAIMNDLVAKRVPGLASINACSVNDGGGTKRDENSVHRLAGRPSHRRLRTSLSRDDIEAEIAAAPQGTFNLAEVPPPEQ